MQLRGYLQSSGEKIPLESTQFLVGGNASNVCVGLSRLGLQSGLVAETGDDIFAEKIVRDLENENVDTTHFLRTPGNASFAIAINFRGERTLFVEHKEREHNFDFSTFSTQWIYLTSMGKKWDHVYQNVKAYCEKNKVKLAFNPGTRQLEGNIALVTEITKNSDILFINKQEGEEILGQKCDSDTQLLRQLHELGAKIVVMTDGNRGSFAVDERQNLYHLSSFPCAVVERTGAGDSFATGFLAATQSGKSVSEAMRWGSLNASAVIGKVGAQPGLLRKNEMEELLAANTQYQPTAL